jgi:hypothetical protein
VQVFMVKVKQNTIFSPFCWWNVNFHG